MFPSEGRAGGPADGPPPGSGLPAAVAGGGLGPGAYRLMGARVGPLPAGPGRRRATYSAAATSSYRSAGGPSGEDPATVASSSQGPTASLAARSASTTRAS